MTHQKWIHELHNKLLHIAQCAQWYIVHWSLKPWWVWAKQNFKANMWHTITSNSHLARREQTCKKFWEALAHNVQTLLVTRETLSSWTSFFNGEDVNIWQNQQFLVWWCDDVHLGFKVYGGNNRVLLDHFLVNPNHLHMWWKAKCAPFFPLW